MTASFFYSFEGTEGVGKTTLIKQLAQQLTADGYNVLCTREPGGTQMAEEIRALCLAMRAESVHAQTELLLMYAARCQHVHQVILPALAAGQVVLCDRYVDASAAYQGYGRGLDIAMINQLNQLLALPMPQLTFWLDMDVELGLLRARNRAQLDRIEQETVAFYKAVQQGYGQLARQFPARIVRLDATLAAEQLVDNAYQHIQQGQQRV